MSKDIYANKIEFRQIVGADVYQPDEVIKRGSHNDKEFSVLINYGELPIGVPPEPPEIIQLTPWDAAFYVAWEFEWYYEQFTVIVTEAGTEIFNGTTDDKSLTLESNLENDVEYSITVTADGSPGNQVSDPTLFTLTNKTPTGLGVEETFDNGGSFSWDSVSGAAGYELLVTDVDTSEEFEYSTTSTNIDITNLEISKSYDIQVRATAEGGIFSPSSYSNKLRFETVPALIITKADMVEKTSAISYSLDEATLTIDENDTNETVATS